MRGWPWPGNRVLGDGVCTWALWPRCCPSRAAWGTAGMSPVPSARFGFWLKLYQSVLSMSSDSLVLDGAIESLLIIQQLLKIQGTLFVSQ